MTEPIKLPELNSEVLADLLTLHNRTSGGVWGQGVSSHQTVAKRDGHEDYRIADFRHARDASFVDVAHKYLPALVEEITRLRAAVEAAMGVKT
jgi:uncharacterized protein YdbL (DUF1318 family)